MNMLQTGKKLVEYHIPQSKVIARLSKEATLGPTRVLLTGVVALLCWPGIASADDCVEEAEPLTSQCNRKVACNLPEAEKNFYWATEENPGAKHTYQQEYDECDMFYPKQPVSKNFYSSILAQKHNQAAICSMIVCWESGELQGVLMYRLDAGELYTGQKQDDDPEYTLPRRDWSQGWEVQ